MLEQVSMQWVRLGSMLKSRALHSDTQFSCSAPQPLPATQAAQLFAGCALEETGPAPTIKARASVRMDELITDRVRRAPNFEKIRVRGASTGRRDNPL